VKLAQCQERNPYFLVILFTDRERLMVEVKSWQVLFKFTNPQYKPYAASARLFVTSQDAHECKMGFGGQLSGSYKRTPIAQPAWLQDGCCWKLERVSYYGMTSVTVQRHRTHNAAPPAGSVRQAMSLHGWLDAGYGELPRARRTVCLPPSRPRRSQSIHPAAGRPAAAAARPSAAVSGGDRRQSQPAGERLDAVKKAMDGWPHNAN